MKDTFDQSNKGIRKKRLKRFILIHGIVVASFVFILLVYKCPFNLIFQMPCPGCGITRAHFALLHFDILGAFTYHPLFFLVIPALIYVPHREVLPWHFKPRTEIVILSVVVVLFILVYIFRLVFGFPFTQ